jgi:site-specific recombinase XerD
MIIASLVLLSLKGDTRMSEKRRDKRNRILREGEVQRADGRYQFRYLDEDGNAKYAYSWRLDKNDPTPKGKKRELSLREKEKQIEANLFDNIVTHGGKYTVLELVEKYTSLKTGVRHSTRAGYKTVINILKKESFGKMRIDKVRLSDAKSWLVKLQQVDGRGYSSIHTIRGVLRPAFQMAVDDDLIRKNPFGFELATVIVNDSVTREAITRKQERELLRFIKEDKHFSRYYEAIFILFNTGLRISEFCGLTKHDIDFKEMRIKVDHQLQRSSQMEYIIQEPKTESGVRFVPMTEEVAECFRRIIEKRKKPSTEPMIDGHVGFLFLDKNDMPMVALHWEKYMEHIIQKYNKIYKIQMPKVTPHVCRHTFCSNMAKSGMNPKTLQYIMGHSDISVTLNTYTHVNFDDAKEELRRVVGS